MRNVTLSIIYVHYNAVEEIIDSIRSVRESSPKRFEIIVVDNQQSAFLKNKLSAFSGIRYIRSKKNLGFGGGCNLGAKNAKGRLLLFLNPDTLVKKGAIEEMVSCFLSNKKTGAIGPQILDSKNRKLPSINRRLTIINSFFVYSFINVFWRTNPISSNFWMYDSNRSKTQFVDAISGACLLIPAKVFGEVKGFDEKFFLYFEEQDLCNRIKDAGYEIIYYPKAKINHLIGRSLKDKEKIKSYFEKSRYIYLKKYYGVFLASLVEIALRILTLDTLFFLIFALLSISINTFQQDRLMLFIGDAAHDFIAALTMVKTGVPPLVGIPSSVTWLHQGPISVWLIALALKIGSLNPIAPALLFGAIGGITTGLVYYLGRTLIGRNVGIISALLYSFSPMVVVNARMPYHTSLVPFFAVLFFLLLVKARKNISFLPIVVFSLGLLLLVELSNVVVLPILIILLYPLQKKISRNNLYRSLLAFMVGISPFVIYELQNGPSYLKFPLWIANRILRLFQAEPNVSTSAAGVFDTFYQQFSSIVFPTMPFLSISIILLSVLIALFDLRKRRLFGLWIIVLWLTVPVLAFALHKSPGTAYFTLLYPTISILIAYSVTKIFSFRVALSLVLIASFMNGMLLLENDFFVNTRERKNPMPPMMYSFGTSWASTNEVAKAIVRDANGREFILTSAGIFKNYKTGIDSYKFLVEINGGKQKSNALLNYEISDTLQTGNGEVIYKGAYERVIKYE